MDVDTFKVRLTALPYLTRTDVASYQQRSTYKGVNLNQLLRKAQQMDARRKSLKIQEKVRDFKDRVKNLSIPKDVYARLISTITAETDISSLRQQAEKIIEKQNDQEDDRFKFTFFDSIRKLNLNKTTVNSLVKRLDRGEDPTVLTQEAYKLQQEQKLKNISDERTFLKNALNRIGIDQPNRNSILIKFQPDKQVIAQLIEEAKQIKAQRNRENVESQKRKLVKLSTTLGINGKILNQIKDVNTKSNAMALKNIINNTGQTVKNTQVATRKLNLISLAKNIGIYSQFAGPITNIKTIKDANVVQVTIREAAKKKLLENALNVGDFTSRIASIKNVTQLLPMKKLIEQTKFEKNVAKRKAGTNKLENSKKTFASEVQRARIPNDKKKLFVNRLKLKNVNIPKLRSDLSTLITNEKIKQQQKDVNELKKYTTTFNINASPFILEFQSSNISLNAIKKKIDDVVKEKKTLKQMKDALNKIIKKASLNKEFTEKLSTIKTKNDALLLNREIDKAYENKLKTNKKALSKIAIESGLTAMNGISSIKNINTLKQANQVLKFQSKVKLDQMARRLGVNVPITNVQTNKNVKNLKVKIANAYNTKQKQIKNEFNRSRRLERANLEVFLNKYSKILTQDERKKFLEYFDKGANLKVLKTNINRYATQKKRTLINSKVYTIRTFLNALGMNSRYQDYFVRRVVAGQNMNTVKKDSKIYMVQLLDDLRRSNADKMLAFLKDLEIKPQNVDRLMKKFATTYIDMNTLEKESKKIENMRNHGNWVESNDEFLNFVDELPLDPDDNVKIKSSFDSDLVNFNTIVNTTIKTSLNTQNEKTNAIRRELMAYIDNHELNTYNKRKLMKKLNSNNSNNSNNSKNRYTIMKTRMLNVKKQANQIKRSTLNKEDMKKRKELINYLNTFKFLTNQEKMFLLQKNKSEIEKYAIRRKRALRFKLRRYIVEKLGLTMDDPEIVKIFENFDTTPEKFNEYAKKATELKQLRNQKNRLRGKTRNDKVLQDIDEIRNLIDVTKINREIDATFMIKMKKQLADLVLDSNMKIKLNLSRIQNPQQINMIIINIKKAYQTKRYGELQQLKRLVVGLTPQNQNDVLQEFVTTDITLKASMKKVSEIEVKMMEDKHKMDRDLLHTFMKKELSLSPKDMNDLLAEFNTLTNLQQMKSKAMQVKKMRIDEQILDNRIKLEKSINSMNLSNVDKKSVLAMYDKKPSSVMLYETSAKQLSAARKKELRNKETANLTNLMKSLKLSESNSKQILNSFTRISDYKLSKAKGEAINLRKKRNNEKLVNALKPLSLPENTRKQLLADTDNVNVVINKAKSLNTKQRTQNATQNQLRIYIASKNLGDKAKNLLNQVNTMSTQNDVKYIREKADQLKSKLDATKIGKKREELSQYMNTIKLNLTQKKSLLQSIGGNTSVNTIKRSIQQGLNTKNKKGNAFVERRTELKLYINALNLPNSEKQKLLRTSGNANTIKKRAQIKLKQLKQKRNAQQKNALKTKYAINVNKAQKNRSILRSIQIDKMRDTRIKAREHLKSLKRVVTLQDRQLLQQLNSRRITLPSFKQMTSKI